MERGSVEVKEGEEKVRVMNSVEQSALKAKFIKAYKRRKDKGRGEDGRRAA